MLPCLVPVLFAFYLQGVLKFKCKIPAPKLKKKMTRLATVTFCSRLLPHEDVMYNMRMTHSGLCSLSAFRVFFFFFVARKMKALISFETSITLYQSARLDILEDLNGVPYLISIFWQ